MTKTRSRLLPLSFCPQLIPLVLSGAKVETMRVVKPQPVERDGVLYWQHDGDVLLRQHIAGAYKLQPGDTFYINEKIEIMVVNGDAVILRYLSDGTEYCRPVPDRIKVPHVGRWRGRIIPVEWARPFRGTVQTVTGKRLKETTEANAIAEGMKRTPICPGNTVYGTVDVWGWGDGYDCAPNALSALEVLWDQINTNPAHQWEADPWITSIAWTPGVAEQAT